LRIDTVALPKARLGEEYSAVVVASGGAPWLETTKPGKTSPSGSAPKRFWEYSPETLTAASAVDAVDFKKKIGAIPAVKRYLDGAVSVPRNLETTWLGGDKRRAQAQLVGYSQDAKAELSDLLEEGVVKEVITYAKPSTLMLRLVALFSRPDGIVVDIGSPAAEMAAVAAMSGRRALYVEFPDNSSLRDTITVPRLLLASRGRHPLPSGLMFTKASGGRGEPPGLFIEGERRESNETAGVFGIALGPQAAQIDRVAGIVELDYAAYPAGSKRFLQMLSSIEGLVPVDTSPAWFAESLTQKLRAVYVPSAEIVDGFVLERQLSAHEDFISSGGLVRLYYHRGMEGASPTEIPGIELRRIPFDLRFSAGLL
jgi:hypothetical protein